MKLKISTNEVLQPYYKVSLFQCLKKDYFLYLMLLPAIIVTFVFAYLPLPGILVAFQDYDIFLGPFKSHFVGLKHIVEIFRLPGITTAIWNTLYIGILTLVFTFPMPLILALLFNELKDGIFKRITQTISYLPHFISWISIIGIISSLFAMYGPVNDIRVLLLGPDAERLMFLGEKAFFIPNVISLSLWKETGWGSVLFLAAISSIDYSLYEAAYIDGAGRFKQMLHITLPGIMPTTVMLLIFKLGGLFASNFELIYGLQNPYIDFEVISTVVFKSGIQQGSYSLATAVGFMQGLVAFLLTAMANKFAKVVSNISIW
jgi:putative aldouronate transport system permease protein